MKKFELVMQTGLVPRSSDTGKDITLRNASEHKRLEGHLKHLDHQLRSKLVGMQAEIMELKASQYGQNKNYKRRPPRLLESRDRTNSDGRLHQRQRRARTLTKDGDQFSPLSKSPLAPPSTPETSDQVKDSKSEIVLPEINPKQICLVGNTHKSSNDPRNSLLYQSDSSKRKNKSGTSCLLNNGFLNFPSLSTFGRPNSLPDLSRLGSNGQNGETVSPRSARRVKFALPEQNNQNNSIANDNGKEPGTEFSSSLELQNTLAERISDFIKQTETETTPSIEVSEAEKDGKEDGDKKDEDADGTDVFYNSMLAKATMEDGFAENAPDLASLGFMDFNEVIDKRLKQTQEELPSEEEMRKIRYLRWRQEAPQVDLVKAVFEKQNDINVEANAENLDINDSKPQLLSDNNEDNRLNPCES